VDRRIANTMRAVVHDAPGPVQSLQIRDLPVLDPVPGWVRIKVLAFAHGQEPVSRS